jgi:protein tyrosine/serine phosphatase
MIKKFLFYFCLFFLCGCAYLSYIKDPFSDVPNFHRVDNVIYRGGQPNTKGWEKIKSLQIKTIISLQDENEDFLKEKEIVLNAGINFYNLPMSVYKQPTDEQVLKFLEIILKKSNQPVFVHCDSGRDRTCAMVALYRVVVCGWTIKDSYTEATKFGFWPYYGEEAVLKKFIHQLKDKKIFFKKAQEFLNEETH